MESLVVHHIKGITDCISEEVLGIDRKLPEATRSIRCGEGLRLLRQLSDYAPKSRLLLGLTPYFREET